MAKKAKTLAQKLSSLKTVCNTDGKGFWSRQSKPVKITGVEIDNIDEAFTYLEVFFSEKSWDVDEDGLIYTDKTWLDSFRISLVKIGFSKKAAFDVDYTEQGTQGTTYVSLEGGEIFTKELVNK